MLTYLNVQKFGKLQIKTPQNVSFYSRKKIEWTCDCGKETTARIDYVLSGHTKSCGRCKEISAEKILTKKFGKLRIKIPQSILPGSHMKVIWICDCGKEKFIDIHNVCIGVSTSCGHCNEISASNIANMKFGKLQIKVPKIIKPGSNQKTEWICDCGRITLVVIASVMNGTTTSCGKCKQLSKIFFAKTKFGKLRMKTPTDFHSHSSKKVIWVCDCGKETSAAVSFVIRGDTTSCGRCKEISAEKISNMKFGSLRIKTPQNITKGSGKKIKWVCDCGKEKFIQIYSVTSGNTKSCGDCYGTVLDWYSKNKKQLKLLKCPVNPENFPPGGVTPLETIVKSHQRFKAICPACKKPWSAYLNDIKQGKSLTCGCSYIRVSDAQRKIFEFIKQYDPNVQLEYKLGAFYYDIFVPSKNLLIEYDGIRYHNSNYSKEKDLRKHKLALDSGYQFMRILEQDWNENKQKICENLVRIMQ